MRLPKYTDDEVKFFHPVFEYSFKPIITNNKFFSNYELVHHRKIKNGTIPDYIFQNKKNRNSVLICEIKRTKSAVFNYNFNEQVRGYAEALKNEMEKPFYILTNLEIINLFRYSEEKSKVIHHIIKPSPIKVGNFENLNFDQFTKKLELHLKDIVKLAFDKKIPEWKFGLSDLERSLENNYKDKKKWNEIISESLSGYIAGSILEKKDITRNEKLINQLLDKNGFTSIRKKINYKKDYKLFNNSIDAGISFQDGADFGFIIQSLIHENYEPSDQGTITSTDDDLSNLVGFFSNFILEKNLNKEELIFDPSAGIGNLLINLKEFHKDLNRDQIWANEKDSHFIDCLNLKLNLIYWTKDICLPAIVTNKDISLLEKKNFEKVKVILSNPPFKRGANQTNSAEKKYIADVIKKNTGKTSQLNIGQLGVECLHLELCVKFSLDLTHFIFIFPTRYLGSLSKESIIFRKFLIKEFGIEYIVKYPHKNIFANVQKNTCILIGKKNSTKKNVEFIEILDDLENISFDEISKIIKERKKTSSVILNKKTKDNLLLKANTGWKEFFSKNSFHNLIDDIKNKFTSLNEDLVDFLPRGNAGNVGGSDYIFPNKNTKIGKEFLKLPINNFILGVKNSEMIPINIDKKNFKYLAFNPKVNLDIQMKNTLYELFSLIDKVQKNLNNKIQYKKYKDHEDKLKILTNSRIYDKNTILIPRATRRHGKIGILSEDAVISTNFILLKPKNTNERYLIVAWFLSIFGQLQLEELSNNERGVRKTEINYLKEKFLIPKFSEINLADKDKIINLVKNQLVNPIDFNNIEISELDNLWKEILFPNRNDLSILKFIELLKLYLEIREP